VLQRVGLALEYPVVFTRDAFAVDNRVLAEVLAPRPRVVCVIDAGVAAAWPGLAGEVEAYARAHGFELLAAPWTVPGGEAAKTMLVLENLWRRLAELHVDRHAFVIAIGGGAMLDVVGFAAATLHRGVRLVRMPTTVLAQNDAGVGVKNGINAFGAKNFLGTFQAPWAVIDDARLLETLPVRDRIAGMAEAVKVALIRDPEFFGWLETNDHDANLDHAIRRCAELHLAHIAGGGDPFEQGNARPLDFGHWSAHKLELLTQHELRHGEAVAIGMAVDTRYSRDTGLLDGASYERVLGVLRKIGLPTWHPALLDPALLAGLGEFREHLGGELTITLLAGIGRGVDARDIDEAAMKRAIAGLAP